MAGFIDKGRISKILPDPKDWYGLPTKAQVNPCTNAGAITPAITIDWRLRGKNGQLKVGDEVAYCLFDDGTGVIFARLDGENSGIIDYDTETTGDVVHDKTVTTIGDTNHKANVLTEGQTTVVKQITGQGGMAVSGGSGASVTGNMSISSGDVTVTGGDMSADGIGLKTHTHTGVHGETSTAH